MFSIFTKIRKYCKKSCDAYIEDDLRDWKTDKMSDLRPLPGSNWLKTGFSGMGD